MKAEEVQISFFRYLASNKPQEVDRLLSDFGYDLEGKKNLRGRISLLQKLISRNSSSKEVVERIVAIHPDTNMFESYFTEKLESEEKKQIPIRHMYVGRDPYFGQYMYADGVNEAIKHDAIQKQNTDISVKNFAIGIAVGFGVVASTIALIKLVK